MTTRNLRGRTAFVLLALALSLTVYTPTAPGKGDCYAECLAAYLDCIRGGGGLEGNADLQAIYMTDCVEELERCVEGCPPQTRLIERRLTTSVDHEQFRSQSSNSLVFSPQVKLFDGH